MIDFTLTRTSRAPIQATFDALTDHRAIADAVWLFRRSTLDREGSPGPDGVGAVRRLVALGPPFVEEITAYTPPTGYAYRMLSGAPTRDHVGTITLRDTGHGTEVSWRLRARLRIPGVERIMLPVFQAVIAALLSGAIATAERSSATAEPLTPND